MRKILFHPTIKQNEALKCLRDKVTEEVLFGGGAGGGKSLLGCFWLISSCMQYPGSRWLLGRAKLKTLKETTLKTMFDTLNHVFGFRMNIDYRYNAMSGTIIFLNTSEIVLKDLFLYPSDPDFDDLGSSEYTGAFIDEISEIVHKAKEIVMTRLRYKTDFFGIIGKALFCTNPSKNWGYSEFYKPNRDKKLPKHRKFIQALIRDNPHIPKAYVESMKKRDKNTKERLLYGNWEYDDDPSRLMEIDAIMDMFSNTFVEEGDKFLISDLAMQGRDKFIITSWNGLRGKIELIKTKSTGPEIENDIRRFAEARKVPRSHIAYDSGGMGEYLSGYLEGIKPFNGATRAIDSDEFRNLRSECYFKLAELVNKRQIYLECDDPDIRDQIVSELEQIKRAKMDDDDVKKQVIKKDQIKEMLGHSPDFADVLMMRMFFEVAKWKAGVLTDDGLIFG